MARPKGSPKFGGRQTGTPNKRTVYCEEARAACERLGFNPMETLIALGNNPDPVIKIQAVKELAKYIFTQRKTVELTGQDGGPVKVQETHPAVAELTELVKLLGNGGKIKP